MRKRITKTVPIEERTDPNGVIYESQKAMCEAWGVPMGTFIKRKTKGYPIEKCLKSSSKRLYNSKGYVDHKGNHFETLTEMCEYWNVSYSAVSYRLSIGKSIEDALTLKLGKGDDCEDHLGNKFPSERQMCEYWNISKSSFTHRKKSGWSLKDILTTPSREIAEPIDHLGNKFGSLIEMLKYYGITYSCFNQRRQRGWSLEKCLTYKRNEIVDHLGNKFNSVRDLCKYHNISYNTFWGRYYIKGLSMEESLNVNIQEIEDHLGNIFHTKQEMCEYWNIPYSVLISREEMGWDLERCLTTKIQHHVIYKNGWKVLNIVYISGNERYYHCIRGSQEEVLTMEEIKSS